MFHFIVACVTMFIASTAAFVIHNKSSEKDNVDLLFMLLASLITSILWFITLPVIVILGSAWFTAKLFSQGRRLKE